MKASEILFVKSILEFLKDNYPNHVERNVVTNQMNVLWDVFTAHNEKGIWIIACTNYWIWADAECQSLLDNLKIICEENDIQVEFRQTYIVTRIFERKQCLQQKMLFLGRVDSKPFHG